MVRLLFVPVLLALCAIEARADARHFTYSYEAEVLPKGQLEFEQWITHRAGKRGGTFSRWDIREEAEYGLTDKLTTALHLNLTDTYSSGVTGKEDESEFDFKGISSEWKYQLVNPILNPVGALAYGEVTYSGDSLELEGKLILSSELGDSWVAAINAIYEAEWEFENGETEREASIGFTGGLAYKVSPQWSVGLEAKNNQAYPDGFNLSGQEYSAWFLGPNVHYGSPDWWMTFTVMPQIYGNGDGALGNIQAVERERLEVRLIAGVLF